MLVSEPLAPGHLAAALKQIYERRQPPVPWEDGDNLPWDDPAFSERMLREHLDQSHGAASRRLPEIRAQVQIMRDWLGLAPEQTLFDVTCGPGLYAAEFAGQGINVSGIDFSPASIAYARQHCAGLPCAFTQRDVRQMDFAGRNFDAAIYIYGQFSVLQPEESRDVLRRIYAALRPGARLLIEILDYRRLHKTEDTWWYTDQSGLWGDFPFLHLGERHWDAEKHAIVERFFVLNLETGQLDTYGLADQAYTAAQVKKLLHDTGFTNVAVHPAWDNLALGDAREWVVYVAERGA
jgi:SAM-dependent methyltransferase